MIEIMPSCQRHSGECPFCWYSFQRPSEYHPRATAFFYAVISVIVPFTFRIVKYYFDLHLAAAKRSGAGSLAARALLINRK